LTNKSSCDIMYIVKAEVVPIKIEYAVFLLLAL